MGFSCGFVGLPNAGKSTIFNAVTSQRVEASAYPFCTIDPHHGIVPLRDRRLEALQKVVGSARIVPTTLEFVDIAGLVRGASTGEGLGNQFLSHLGRVDAVAHVVRCFEDQNVSHPSGGLDPAADADLVTTELILKDLEIVENNFKKLKTAARTGDSGARKEAAVLEELSARLSEGKEIRRLQLDDETWALSRRLNLITAKPLFFIANVDENHLHQSPLVEALERHARAVGTGCISFCGKTQAEISELDHEDQLVFLREMGLDETGLQKLVRTGYTVLNLITFFTANENECHAWTVSKGATVQEAAGKVHSDFEKGFIKAEVVPAEELIRQGSLKNMHEQGQVSAHGREYIVRDGDLIYIHARP